jgi:hypothetical protein
LCRARGGYVEHAVVVSVCAFVFGYSTKIARPWPIRLGVFVLELERASSERTIVMGYFRPARWYVVVMLLWSVTDLVPYPRHNAAVRCNPCVTHVVVIHLCRCIFTSSSHGKYQARRWHARAGCRRRRRRHAADGTHRKRSFSTGPWAAEAVRPSNRCVGVHARARGRTTCAASLCFKRFSGSQMISAYSPPRRKGAQDNVACGRDWFAAVVHQRIGVWFHVRPRAT